MYFKTATQKTYATTDRKIAAIISTGDGSLVEVYFFEHSGKVVTRKKIHTTIGVNHPGIVIGEDAYGRWWIAHNHISHKKPIFETFDGYTAGNQGFWDIKAVVHFSPETVIERAIEEAAKGIAYHTIRYNCQTYVNLVIRNEHSSEAIDTLSKGAMVAGGITALLGLAFGNKGVAATGAAIFAAGGGAKIYSNRRK